MRPIDQLRLYLQRADYLAASDIVKNATGSKLNISWRQGQPWRWTSQEPRAEDLESLLLRLRPFLSEREPVHLFRIFNLCQQTIRSGELKAALITERESWANAQKHGVLGLNIDGRGYTPEYVTDLMINGLYFHTGDDAKRAELAALVPEAALLARHVFLDYVYRAIEHVLYVASVVRLAVANHLIEDKAA